MSKTYHHKKKYKRPKEEDRDEAVTSFLNKEKIKRKKQVKEYLELRKESKLKEQLDITSKIYHDELD